MHASHKNDCDNLFHHFTSMGKYHSAHERRQLTPRIIQLLLTAITDIS